MWWCLYSSDDSVKRQRDHVDFPLVVEDCPTGEILLALKINEKPSSIKTDVELDIEEGVVPLGRGRARGVARGGRVAPKARGGGIAPKARGRAGKGRARGCGARGGGPVAHAGSPTASSSSEGTASSPSEGTSDSTSD